MKWFLDEIRIEFSNLPYLRICVSPQHNIINLNPLYDDGFEPKLIIIDLSKQPMKQTIYDELSKNIGIITNHHIIRDIVDSLYSTCGIDNILSIDPQSVHGLSSVELFNQKWNMKRFYELLHRFNIKDNIKYEDALAILDKYYIIDPIMKS
jgi:hypothetical protein